MTISPALLKLVQHSEACVLHPYRDTVGVWTIGWGHTGPAVHEETPPITQETADALLAGDLAYFELGVRRLCPGVEGARLDALIDFAFNCGLAALAHGGHDGGPSGLYRRVLAADWAGAAHEIRRWDHAGGQVLPGLTVRRAIEAAWLESGTHGNFLFERAL